MSGHDGHRERLRQRFIEEGLDHFEPKQVLELLLFFCIPRKDTNELAGRLLEHFGGFRQVVEAPVDVLKTVDGLGDKAALFLSLMNQYARYYQVKEFEEGRPMTSLAECNEYLARQFVGRRNETVFVLFLDAKCKMIHCRNMGEGSVNSAAVPIRRIVELALSLNASSVVLAHNHPSGIALPSDDDVLTTKRLARALRAVDVELVDHIVVADGDFVSMVHSKLYMPDVDYSDF